MASAVQVVAQHQMEVGVLLGPWSLLDRWRDSPGESARSGLFNHVQPVAVAGVESLGGSYITTYNYDPWAYLGMAVLSYSLSLLSSCGHNNI